MIEFINKHLPPRISIPLILHILIIGGILYVSQSKEWILISQKLNESLPILTITTMVSSLYLVLLVSYISLYLNVHKKLKPKLGVLWDKDKEPYCPIHEKPLARHKTKQNGQIVTSLDCKKCNQTYPLITDDCSRLTLEDAKKLL
jgi:uncharacterized protein YbaR (Trm112 family)